MVALEELLVVLKTVLRFLIFLPCDVLSTAAGLLACMMLWRAPSVLSAMYKATSDRGEYYGICFLALSTLILDLLSIVLLIPAFLAPWRSCAVYRDLARAAKSYDEDSELKYNFELRSVAIREGLVLAWDAITFPFGFAALLVPSRTVSVVQSYRKCLETFAKEGRSNLAAGEIEYAAHLRLLCIKQFAISIVEVLCAPFVLLAIVVPWRTVPALLSMRAAQIRGKNTVLSALPCQGHAAPPPTASAFETEWNARRRNIGFRQGLYAFLDLLCVPFAILAFFRFPAVVSGWLEISKESTPKKAPTATSEPKRSNVERRTTDESVDVEARDTLPAGDRRRGQGVAQGRRASRAEGKGRLSDSVDMDESDGTPSVELADLEDIELASKAQDTPGSRASTTQPFGEDMAQNCYRYDFRYRRVVLENFFLTILDVICLIVLVPVFLTVWRVPCCLKIAGEGAEEWRTSFGGQLFRRLLALRVLADLVVDLPFALCFVFLHVTVWRLPTFYPKLRTLLSQGQTRGNGDLVDGAEGKLPQSDDLPGARASEETPSWRKPLASPEAPLDFEEMCDFYDAGRSLMASEAALTLRDFPFIVLFGLLIATVYRLPNVIMSLVISQRSTLDPQQSKNKRKVLLACTKVRLSLPQAGGTILSLRGRRPPGYTKSETVIPLVFNKLELHIAGEELFQAVSGEFGQLVSMSARNLLPLKLARRGRATRHLSDEHLESIRKLVCREIELGEDEEMSFDLDLDFNVKGATIRKKLRKLVEKRKNPSFYIQIEHISEGERVIVISAKISAAELLASIESDDGIEAQMLVPGDNTGVKAVRMLQGQGAADETEDPSTTVTLSNPKPLQDVFFFYVGLETIQLGLDLIYLVAFCSLLLCPWRFLQTVSRLFETDEQHRKRALYAALQWHEPLIKLQKEIYQCLEEVAADYYKYATDDWTADAGTHFKAVGDIVTGISDEIERRLPGKLPAYKEIFRLSEHVICTSEDLEFEGKLMSINEAWFRREEMNHVRTFYAFAEAIGYLKTTGDAEEALRFGMSQAQNFQTLDQERGEGRISDSFFDACSSILDRTLSSQNHLEVSNSDLALLFKRTAITVQRQASLERMQKEMDASLVYMAGALRVDIRKGRHALGNLIGRRLELSRNLLRNMVVVAFKDIFTIFALIPLLLSLYRLPQLKAEMSLAKHGEWYRRAILNQSWELLQDLVYLGGLLVVLASVYFTLDVMIDLARSTGISDARLVIKHYLSRIGDALVKLFTLVTAANVYVFTLAIVVYSLFVPAEIFSTMLHSAFGVTQGVKILSYGTLAIWLTTFFVPPFALVNGVIDRCGEREAGGVLVDEACEDGIEATICAYFAVLFLLAALSVGVLVNVEEFKDYTLNTSPERRIVNLNKANITAFLLVVVETVQLCAIAFQAAGAGQAANGSSADEAFPPVTANLVDGSDAVLLSFDSPLRGGSVRNVAVVFDVLTLGWIAAGVVAVFIIIVSAPTVIEEMLEWRHSGTIATTTAWKNTMVMLCRTFYLPLIQTLARTLVCVYDENTPAVLLSDANTSSLDSATKCWVDEHRSLAMTAMFLLTFFVCTAQSIATLVAAPKPLSPRKAKLALVGNDSDRTNEPGVFFSPYFTYAMQLGKLFLGIFVVILYDREELVLSMVLLIALGLGLYSVFHNMLHGAPVCSDDYLAAFRSGGLLAVAYTAVMMLIIVAKDNPSSSHDALLLGYLLVLAGTCGAFVRVYLSRKAETRDPSLQAQAETAFLETVPERMAALALKDAELLDARGQNQLDSCLTAVRECQRTQRVSAPVATWLFARLVRYIRPRVLFIKDTGDRARALSVLLCYCRRNARRYYIAYKSTELSPRSRHLSLSLALSHASTKDLALKTIVNAQDWRLRHPKRTDEPLDEVVGRLVTFMKALPNTRADDTVVLVNSFEPVIRDPAGPRARESTPNQLGARPSGARQSASTRLRASSTTQRRSTRDRRSRTNRENPMDRASNLRRWQLTPVAQDTLEEEGFHVVGPTPAERALAHFSSEQKRLQEMLGMDLFEHLSSWRSNMSTSEMDKYLRGLCEKMFTADPGQLLMYYHVQKRTVGFNS